jgi:anti-sigma regulatory factor (Ser/Thr protein kinase)
MEVHEGDSAVPFTRQVSVRLPSDQDAPGAARALLEEVAPALPDRAKANLHVAISELVTNAVVHGAPGEVGLRIAAEGDKLRVEVSDAGMRPFEWRPTPGGTEGGWGLHLVDEFTDRCGVERRPHTVAWCELDLEPRATG